MYKKSRILKRIRENLQSGGGLHNSCKAAGISFVTLWTWRNMHRRIDNYINRILESRVQLVEDALYKNAISGNPTAQIFFLKNRGKNWRDVKDIRGEGFNETKVIIINPPNKKKVRNQNRSKRVSIRLPERQ